MLIDYTEIIEDDLKDPDFAAGLLSMCLEEEGFSAFLVSLRDIVKVRGGMTALAKKTGLNRESLYRALSPHGNPEFMTIVAILKTLDLKVDVVSSTKTAAEAVAA